MQPYSLIIFDLDGTLINSVKDLAFCTNYALEQLGFPTHSEDKYRFFVGNGVDLLLIRALPEQEKTEANLQKMRKIMIPYYSEHCTDKTAPYPNIKELLNDIEVAGIKLAVASNKYHAATIEMVQHYFPNNTFVDICGQREGFPLKPDAKVVEQIIEKAEVEISKVLYVGDTAVDIKTAQNAKVDVVAVSWGFRPRTELEDNAPTHIADSVAQLREIIFGK